MERIDGRAGDIDDALCIYMRCVVTVIVKVFTVLILLKSPVTALQKD